MAFSHNPPKIIPAWMLISTLLVFWDCGYILLRPRSMPGGDLHLFWKPYTLYSKVDYVYGFPAYESNDGFPGAVAFMNLVESALNFIYLSRWAQGDAAAAVIVGLVSVIMTLSKTILYISVEYFSGWEHIGHNDISTLIPLYIIPNGFWIVLPSYCAWWFANDIYSGLSGKKRSGSAVSAKKEL